MGSQFKGGGRNDGAKHYHDWFGIALDDCPPNFYQLLNVQPFEADPERIKTAARRRLHEIAQRKDDTNTKIADQLGAQVRKVAGLLLDVSTKADYDAGLRGRHQEHERVPYPSVPSSQADTATEVTSQPRDTTPQQTTEPAEAPRDEVSEPVVAQRDDRRSPVWIWLSIVLALNSVVLTLILVFMILKRPGDSPQVAQVPAPTNNGTPNPATLTTGDDEPLDSDLTPSSTHPNASPEAIVGAEGDEATAGGSPADSSAGDDAEQPPDPSTTSGATTADMEPDADTADEPIPEPEATGDGALVSDPQSNASKQDDVQDSDNQLSQSNPAPSNTADNSPFRDLLREIELPEVPTSSSQVSGVADAGIIGERALTALQIQLDSGAADLDGVLEFTLFAVDEGQSSTRRWHVLVAPKSGTDGQSSAAASAGIDLEKPIAHIFIDDSLRLRFQWRTDTSFAKAPQLANSLLYLTHDNETHSIAFRKPQRGDQWLLELTHKEITIPLEFDTRPADEKIALEMSAVHGVDVPVKFEPEARRVHLNERGRAIIGEGQEVEIQFELKEDREKQLSAVLRPRYPWKRSARSREMRYELTEKKVRSQINALQRNINQGWEEYYVACRDLPGMQSRIGELIAKLRGIDSRDTRRRDPFLKELQLLQPQADKHAGTIERQHKQMPESYAALRKVLGVAKIGGALHGRSRLELRLFGEGTSGEVDLVRMTSDIPVAAEAPFIDFKKPGPLGRWIRVPAAAIFTLSAGGNFQYNPANGASLQGTWTEQGGTVVLEVEGRREQYQAYDDFQLSSETATLFRVFGV